ncbi:hypothetical protein FA95DRAFT_718695 [Auriscalpium vulgare]|uniref:Uncharacterized protein n=1 Tax=Auriscalpium vulgare TaxID=40419 RepID=A0ACB8SA86_9AGAM|nr:hypothetical protein FA95DRAFT_718695 [Auriscalpium vulgare]
MRAALPWIACISGAFRLASAFSFTNTPLAECGVLTVSWQGGQPPFTVGVFPAFQDQYTFQVDNDAFNTQTGQGQFSSPTLLIQSGTKVLVVMSDATGFASGGVSEVVTVAAAAAGSSCTPTKKTPAWTYATPSALQQCGPFIFNDYSGAVQPVKIFGLIPGGQLLTLQPPSGQPSFTWPEVSVAAGTSIMFSMIDSRNISGGLSDVTLVALSSDATCLNAQSPSSTAQSTSQTASSTSSQPSSSASQSSTTSGRSSGISTAAIIAIGVALLLIIVVISIILLVLRRRKRNPSRSHFNLDDGHETPALLPAGYHPEPYTLSAPTPYELSTIGSTTSLMRPMAEEPQTAERPVPSASTPSYDSLPPRKGQGADASTRHTARLIVHTDVDEEPDEHGVVELPPQYSESRRPIPGLSPSLPAASSSTPTTSYS